MTTRTLDRDASAFFTTEPLGASQKLTPEGFLLCKGVRIARLGMMMYTQHDLPHLIPADDGFIRVTRDAEDLFHPDALASFEGKPVTNDHPEDDVTPDNWKQIAVGTTHNVRRGEGIDDQYMIADLLITDRDAIDAVRDGKREVSNGYDADYLQTAPGHARQHSIIGNHVALVDRGRCGPRCAIQDKETENMTKQTPIQKLKAAFGTRDAKAFDEAAAEIEAGQTGGPEIHIHNSTKDSAPEGLESRLVKLEKTLDSLTTAIEGLATAKDNKTKDEDEEEEKKKTEDADEDEDEKKKTEDELFEEEEEDKQSTKDTASEYAAIVSTAEIIAPGFKLPKLTQDAQSSKKKSKDALCACKRRALDAAVKTEAGKKAVSPFLRGRTIDKLSAEAVDAAFYGAAEVMRSTNNSRASVKDADQTKTIDAFSKGGINAINKQFWANRK